MKIASAIFILDACVSMRIMWFLSNRHDRSIGDRRLPRVDRGGLVVFSGAATGHSHTGV